MTAPLTPQEQKLLRDLEYEVEKPIPVQRSTGPTGDLETDRFILQKIMEDNNRPPTTFTERMERRDPILGFNGPYRFLSNFWECRIRALKWMFPSVENAYQAAKRPDDPDFHRDIAHMTPGDAKKYARTLPITAPDWDTVTKFSVMRELLRQKFSVDENLMFMLLGTGHAHLEEVNSWGDKVWGTDCEDKLHPLVSAINETVYNGENHLGKMLMEVRHECRLRIAGVSHVITREDVYR